MAQTYTVVYAVNQNYSYLFYGAAVVSTADSNTEWAQMRQ